jgi:hypothetical protein
MGLTLRNTVNRPITWAEGDANFNYLLTNMSGSAISISGSTVGIKSNGFSVINGAITARSLAIGDRGTGIITENFVTIIGDWQNGNNGTVLSIDDDNQIIGSNVGIAVGGSSAITGSLNVTDSVKFGNGDGAGADNAGNIFGGTINIGGNYGSYTNPDGFCNDGSGNSYVGDSGVMGSGTYLSVTDNGFDEYNQPLGGTFNFFGYQGLVDDTPTFGVNASIESTHGAISFDQGNITSNGLGKLTTKGLTVTGSLNVSGSAVITGSLNVTGSTTINNILTLTPRTTTPSAGQFTTGSMIVSGSGTNVHAYFYNGTAWKQLDN